MRSFRAAVLFGLGLLAATIGVDAGEAVSLLTSSLDQLEAVVPTDTEVADAVVPAPAVTGTPARVDFRPRDDRSLGKKDKKCDRCEKRERRRVKCLNQCFAKKNEQRCRDVRIYICAVIERRCRRALRGFSFIVTLSP